MALPVGTVAPAFTTTDTNGNTVSLSDFAGKIVVLFFYPEDDTPDCIKEACSFRDAQTEYTEKGIVVLGVSVDGQEDHQKFTTKYNLNFPLLVDTDCNIITAYDVNANDPNDDDYAQRVTYVIDGSGKITHVDTAVNAPTHASDVLAVIGF
ncbi:MAG: peroxiredoxin [Aphanizomenon gracile PMC649.10]|nr:peroxiredoxin [Aphanizomenon gracile PMC649.10]